MKKIIITIAICFILITGSGIIYLNNVFLPKTAKSLIVKSIENAIHKKAEIGSVKVNIFKGIVLRDVVVYDNDSEIIKVKEASCIFWFWGIIQRKIVIPSINLNSASIYLQRRKDSSFNLSEVFVNKKEDSLPLAKDNQAVKSFERQKSSPAGFIFEVYRINVINSVIKFRDQSLEEEFSLDLSDVDLNIYLSLPASIKFKGSAQYPGNLRPNIYINGEYKFNLNELKANLILKNIPPSSFQGYYRSSGVLIKDGTMDLSASLRLKDDLLNMQCDIKANSINLKKEDISVLFTVDSNVNLKYQLSSQLAKYQGRAVFVNTVISGLDYIKTANIQKGTLDFSESEANSNDISASIFDIPVSAKVRVGNYADPKLNLQLASKFELSYAQKLAKEKFNFFFPGQAYGNASVSLSIISEGLSSKQPSLSGLMDLAGVSLKLDKVEAPIQEINGKAEFTSDQAFVKALSFKYQDTLYNASLSVKNFQLPVVSISLSSEDLSLKSDFNVNKSRILIKDLSGKYLNSVFKASGNFDTVSFNTDVSGSLSLNLEDLSTPLNKFKEQFKQIQPKGRLDLSLSVGGDIRDTRSCSFDIQFSSPQLSFYGLKAGNFIGSYRQIYGIADIPSLAFDFYGGKVSVSFRTNLKSENLPYSVNLVLEGVKIEELKMDTAAKAKDIAGIINGNVKLSGFSNDLSKLYGAGSLGIVKGKLWELDLFKGMGKLLFAKDFANIVFYEGACNFIVQDKYIFTDNLTLKSNMASLYGKAKVGFDNTIDAVLNIDIIDELVPLSGTFKDITTTVIGKSGKFATINITGTLKDPKYKFKPAVENIIRGIADTLKKAVSRKQAGE